MKSIAYKLKLIAVLVLLVSGSKLEAQLLDIDPVDVTRAVEATVNATIRETRRDIDTAGTIANDLLENSAPLRVLPESLPVLTVDGEIAFVDVLVEDGWRAVKAQWLGILEHHEVALLQSLDIDILEQEKALGLSLVRFRVPSNLDSRAALQKVLPAELMARLDRNHIYSPQNQKVDKTTASEPLVNELSRCNAPLKVGMIDTAIETGHPAFKESLIIQKNFIGNELDVAQAHGTAVAGILVGVIGDHPARLAGTQLYNASVFFRRSQFSQGATMMHLISALAWLQKQNVRVVNMSLAGPDNRILAAAVKQIVAADIIIVAAVGNEGPSSPPLYPAAYDQVIAVTAVDEQHKIYRWANRGEHVDFAALGVSVNTARVGKGFGRESGTSMASPVVTAMISCELARANTPEAKLQGGMYNAMYARLVTRAQDLGEEGHDAIYGVGLLRP